MNIIEVKATQINGIFFETTYNKAGGERLRRSFDYYRYVESYPIIERTSKNTFRLITHQENYEFYKRYQKDTPFKAHLKKFKNDEERYLELLKQLCDGKAKSFFNDKYIILKNLLLSMTEKEISQAIKLPISEIRKNTINEDEYKPYLEKAVHYGVRTTMVSVVSYFKKSPYIKEKARNFILNLTLNNQKGLLKLTKSKWDITRSILEGIKAKYRQLNEEQQEQILHEIIRDGWTVLIDHFHSRCMQILNPTATSYKLDPNIFISHSTINLRMNLAETTNNYLS
jgi:hypothetical protein